MSNSDHLQICCACGTQSEKALPRCNICDDPRQFVPATGQTWTSLDRMRGEYRNSWTQDSRDSRMWSIVTEPKFAIGQRCILLETAHGNILWDCVTLIDDETIEFVRSKGKLSAIVISHPHYYTTHLEWARAFDCPVYIAADDQEWLSRDDPAGRRVFLDKTVTDVVEDVQAIKVGGHFPGSLVLLWEKKLFIADSFVTVPVSDGAYRKIRKLSHFRPTDICKSAHSYDTGAPGTTSYAFMWSIPNMIPLPPTELLSMWRAMAGLEFTSTHGAFVGTDVHNPAVKDRVLESMKIQARASGWTEATCAILQVPPPTRGPS